MWVFRRDNLNFEQIHGWYQNLPELFKVFSIFKNKNKGDFFKALNEGRNYGGIFDGELKSMVHGEIKDGITIEGHLFCDPSSTLDEICQTVTYAKVEALKEFEFVATQTLRRHKILHEVMKRTGFVDTGLRSYNTVYRGQMLEVVHYLARRS